MGRMLAWVVVGVGVGVFAVCPLAKGADKAELLARVRKAAESSSIDDPALKPWHLTVSFQLLDKKGVTTEEGTLEEWWSADKDKRVYSSPSYTATEVRRGEDVYRTTVQRPVPYLLETLRREIVHPIPDIDSKDLVPDQHRQQFGEVKLDCITMARPVMDATGTQPGMFPTYCIDQDQNRLRYSFRYGSETVTRNHLGTFQGKSVPVDLAVAADSVPAAKGHISSLAGFAPDEHSFDTNQDLTLQDAGFAHAGKDCPKLVKRVNAEYPRQEGRSGVSGNVKLDIVVGTDGRIRDASVVTAPSGGFASSAMKAAQQYIFTPCLVNGVPHPVRLQILIDFHTY